MSEHQFTLCVGIQNLFLPYLSCNESVCPQPRYHQLDAEFTMQLEESPQEPNGEECT